MNRQVDSVCKAILSGDRRLVAKTITLLESSRDDHQVEGQAILEKLVPETGKAIRVGVTGPPGVGKSTSIACINKSIFLLWWAETGIIGESSSDEPFRNSFISL